MTKLSTSGIYRFPPENLSNDVYSPTTIANKNNKKRPTLCFTSVASVLLMLGFVSCFSVIYITDNYIGYYENVEKDIILKPGFYLQFIWSSENLKFASIKDSFFIPTAFGGDFNITVDYTVIDVKEFVKSLQQNDKNCLYKILTFVQQKIMEPFCMNTVLHNGVYEITPLVNSTINECGIQITNATSPKNFYNSTECQPVAIA
jgi:hypothetical protein